MRTLSAHSIPRPKEFLKGLDRPKGENGVVCSRTKLGNHLGANGQQSCVGECELDAKGSGEKRRFAKERARERERTSESGGAKSWFRLTQSQTQTLLPFSVEWKALRHHYGMNGVIMRVSLFGTFLSGVRTYVRGHFGALLAQIACKER